MKEFHKICLTTLAAVLSWTGTEACTNFIVTKGASTDGSVMVTYAADSHQLYGCLYHYMPSRRAARTMPVYEWDTGRYIGDIAQAAQTYTTVGNMNEHSLIITETTYGGRDELTDPAGKIDYGSLIYITLQRARTAREAIGTIVDLANTYGTRRAARASRSPMPTRRGSWSSSAKVPRTKVSYGWRAAFPTATSAPMPTTRA